VPELGAPEAEVPEVPEVGVPDVPEAGAPEVPEVPEVPEEPVLLAGGGISSPDNRYDRATAR
jgi:hypothetical protein